MRDLLLEKGVEIVIDEQKDLLENIGRMDGKDEDQEDHRSETAGGRTISQSRLRRERNEIMAVVSEIVRQIF